MAVAAEPAPPGTRKDRIAMVCEHCIDDIIIALPRLGRDQCKAFLRGFNRPRLDFTDDFLDRLSLDSLQHLLRAACEQVRVSGHHH